MQRQLQIQVNGVRWIAGNRSLRFEIQNLIFQTLNFFRVPLMYQLHAFRAKSQAKWDYYPVFILLAVCEIPEGPFVAVPVGKRKYAFN